MREMEDPEGNVYDADNPAALKSPIIVAPLGSLSSWNPIETAPMDGTEILTYRGRKLMAVAMWTGREWLCVDGMALLNVTHWMPLPAPPARSA